MKTNVKVLVTAAFDINTENAKELHGMDHFDDKMKGQCVAKALADIVEVVLNKHFENDKNANVSFITAETVINDD